MLTIKSARAMKAVV